MSKHGEKMRIECFAWICIIFTALLLIPCSSSFIWMEKANCQASTRLFINPQSLLIENLNETFNVTVEISNVQDLYAYEFKISWDPNIISCIDRQITPPDVWGENFLIAKNELNNTGGYLYIAVGAMNPAPPFDGNSTLAILTFKATNVGNSSLTIFGDILGNYDAESIPHETSNGKVEVIPEFSALSILITLILLTAFIFHIKRHKNSF